MSVVIIGGNECMSRQYADVCMAHGCTAKVFPKETGPIEKKIGSPDLMILFTRTVSHKMVHCALAEANKGKADVVRCHTSSSSALHEILKNACCSA